MAIREPFASDDDVKRNLPHPRAHRTSQWLRPLPRPLGRVRCRACGETAYGATLVRARNALDESPCLPVELAWNDRMYGAPVTA